MSLRDLSKEQKQYVALGALAVAILVILMVLGVRFSMSTISAAKEELDDLTAKISNANRALSRSRQTSEDYVETAEVLRHYLMNAPPERNYYSWATEVIYSKARLTHLEIDSIDEISIPQRQRPVAGAAPISFESYSIRIMAHGGYENTKYFLNLLKQDFPLLRFSGVEISSGQSPESHDIQLFMQWPFNFGELTKNWETVASTKMKIEEDSDGRKDMALEESGSAQDPAAPVPPVAGPDTVREPYPPNTRPDVEETPAPRPAVKPAVPITQPGMDAERQRVITQSEPLVEPKPVAVPKAVAAAPEPVVAPPPQAESMTGPDPEPAVRQPQLPVISDTATDDTATASGPAPIEAMEAAAQQDPPPAAESPRNYVSTGKSEKLLEGILNKGNTREDASLSSFLDGLVGEINEK